MNKTTSDEMHDFLESCIRLPAMCDGEQWRDFRSFYDPRSKKFFWAEASGCSCYGLWDKIQSLTDFQFGNKNEFLKAASEYAGYCQAEYCHQEDLNAIREAVRGLKNRR